MNLPKAGSPHEKRPAHRLTFPVWRRLTRSAEIRETFAQGRRWVGRYMVLWLRTGEGASMRVAVVASRKVGPAVQRTRAKRRLREVFRTSDLPREAPYDLVLVARRALLEASWSQVVAEFRMLVKKAGIKWPAPEEESW